MQESCSTASNTDNLNLSHKKIPHVDLTDLLFSDLLTKINFRGKRQRRAIIITSDYLYNCKPSSFKLKRAIKIHEIIHFTLSTVSQNFIIHTSSGYDYNFNYSSPKVLIDIIIKAITEKNKTSLSGAKEIPIYFVNKVNLLNYTRTATKHKKLNKERKAIKDNTDANDCVGFRKLSKIGRTSAVYKMPSAAQVKRLFDEKMGLLVFYGIANKSKPLSEIEMWDKILKLKEKQKDGNDVSNFINWFEYVSQKNKFPQNNFFGCLKHILSVNSVLTEEQLSKTFLNSFSFNPNFKPVRENSPIITDSKPTATLPKKSIIKKLNLSFTKNRPTIVLPSIPIPSLSTPPVTDKPSSPVASGVKSEIKKPEIFNIMGEIDLTSKRTVTKPITKHNKNVHNNKKVHKKRFRKLHLKELNSKKLKNSLFDTTPSSTLKQISSLLISSFFEPSFQVNYSSSSPNPTAPLKATDKKLITKSNQSHKTQKNDQPQQKKEIRREKIKKGPAKIDLKTEQDFTIMFYMFKCSPLTILLNILNFNKDFCTAENLEKLYLGLSSLLPDYNKFFTKHACSLSITDSEEKFTSMLRTSPIITDFSKTEKYLVTLFIEPLIITKLRNLLEARNYLDTKNSMVVNIRKLRNISDTLGCCENIIKVILGFNCLYNELNKKDVKGFEISELKYVFDFTINESSLNITDYILSEFTDIQLLQKKLNLKNVKSLSKPFLDLNKLRKELENGLEAKSVNFYNLEQNVKSLNILTEKVIKNEKNERFKKSWALFLKENGNGINEIKEEMEGLRGSIGKVVVLFKGENAVKEGLGTGFEDVLGVLEKMKVYVDAYVKKISN